MEDRDSFFNLESIIRCSSNYSNIRPKEKIDLSLMSSQTHLMCESNMNSSKHSLETKNSDDEGIYEQMMLHAFKKSLTASHRDIFTLLEDYKGICSEMMDACKNLSSLLFPIPSKKAKVNQMMSLISMEFYTWMLVQALYRERAYSGSKNMDDFPTHVDIKDSEKEIMAHLFSESSMLRQAQVVIDWLEFQLRCQTEGQYNIEFLSEHGSSRENTLHLLLHRENDIHSHENLVTELDPDGPIRQNKKLSGIDDDDEDRLLCYIFSCIKSGQLDEACKICIRTGQPWRAVTLQGWKLFHDPNIKSLGPGGVVQKIEGNHFRDLWRNTCWQMADNDKISTVERAVYASLSCHLKNLLPACKSWHEYLWAYMKSFVDQKLESHIRISLTSNKFPEPVPNEFHVKLLNFEEIFCEIESSSNEEIKKQCQHRFNMIQKFIILDQIEILVECMSKWCEEDTLKPHPILLRFMTHLLLFFKNYGISFPSQHEATVISSYVDWLVEVKQIELIAIYTSYLQADLQILTYAKFLEGIKETECRKHCMELAESAGLNTKMIALTVVQNVCKDVPSIDKNLFNSLLTQDMDEDDLMKISAIEWLLLNNGWRLEALQQSNALFRMFLSFRKINACNKLMKLIPRNSIEMIIKIQSSQARSLSANVKNTIREFMCVSAYLEAQESFSQWFDHFHTGIPIKPSVLNSNGNLVDKVLYEHMMRSYDANLGTWKKSLASLANNSISRIKEVLHFADGGWMVDQEDEEDQSTRKQEMNFLRQLCLPFLFTLLQTVYHSMERFEECGQLYDVLMSEHHQLYMVFSQEELERFSHELVSSSINSLNLQMDGLGHSLY